MTDQEVSERTWRPLIMGRRGAVATNHPLATEAGLATLRRGGHAVDAYVAAASTLAVVEPHMSGVGGEGFALVYDAAAQHAHVVNATGRAPHAAKRERYHGTIPTHGPLTTITPCLVDGWLEAHTRWGTLPLATLFESAISHAHDGFAATRTYCHFAREYGGRLRDDEATARVFLPGGELPHVGTVIRQGALARTLEEIAQGGRAAFFEGELARRLANWCRENGGLLSESDLRESRSTWQEPIRTTYRGLEVLEAPPNSTGLTLLQELNVAEQIDLARLGGAEPWPFLTPDLVHTLVEIKKLCFLDRERISDRTDEATIEEFLSPERAQNLAAQIDPKRAIPRPVDATPAGRDTTYLAVVDGQGNAVSGIQSLNDAFGAAVIAGDTGILLNNRMRYWHLEAGHANDLEPGRRVRHTMNPPLALKDGRPYIVFGTPGAEVQVQVNLQVFTALVDFGLNPQQAVEMARWQSNQPGTLANWPHTTPDQLIMEDRFPETTRRELAARGHQVVIVGPLDGPCSVNVIRHDPDTGFWQAGSDPRRDGYALAF